MEDHTRLARARMAVNKNERAHNVGQAHTEEAHRNRIAAGMLVQVASPMARLGSVAAPEHVAPEEGQDMCKDNRGIAPVHTASRNLGGSNPGEAAEKAHSQELRDQAEVL